MELKLITTRTCHCVSIEQELGDIGIPYELLYAEDHPELVDRLGIRHCPALIINGERLVPLGEIREGELRRLLNFE
ncbi:glutaredoxin family protein [Thiobacillus sp.]